MSQNVTSNNEQSKFIFYVGSYSNFDILAHLPDNEITGKGIYSFEFNNGEIKPVTTTESENPAVLSFHPAHKDILYSLSEGIKDNGTITAYKKKGADLQKFGEWQTKGMSTCYFKICPDTLKYGIAINYWEGSLDLFELCVKTGKIVKHLSHINQNDLSLYDKNERRQVENRVDHWENRQVGAHAHSVHFYKNNIYIPDLGENSIFHYEFKFDSQNVPSLKYMQQIELKDGAGPRHMVFAEKLGYAYVSNELDSSVCVLKIQKNGDLKIVQHIDTYDKNKIDFIDVNNYVAEICISKDEKFIYVSNRGVNKISIFKVDQNNGKLVYINGVDSYGKTPRHFVITPDNNFIILANQDSNNLVVFKRNVINGLLKLHNIYDNKTFKQINDKFDFNAPNYILCDSSFK